MEIDRVAKICHVSAYVAYEHCEPVYKKTFKFEISPSTHNSIIWDKIIKILKKNDQVFDAPGKIVIFPSRNKMD